MIPEPLDAAGLGRLLDRPGVRACLDALRASGEETRLVGGCVRDALLGRDVADIDLATTLPPARTMERAQGAGIKAVPTGFAHGTVTLVVAGRPYEVTTLREDIETDGRHAVVRFGRDFARDAERRDFTINALSLDEDGTLHDTTGGVADLAAGRVRFIGESATRIREDALRILRFFRFHARYGQGAPDQAGLAASVAARDALDRLSRERVRAEFLKLLRAPRALAAVAILSETGLLGRLTGGVGDLGRLARAIGNGQAGDAVQRLAALCVQSGQDAVRLDERLRLSNAERARLDIYAACLTACRTRETIAEPQARALAATYGRDALRETLAILHGEPRPQVAPAVADELDALTGPLVLPVTGADLVAHGIPRGRAIGIGLEAARTLWLSEGCPSGEGARERLLDHALAAARTTRSADAE